MSRSLYPISRQQCQVAAKNIIAIQAHPALNEVLLPSVILRVLPAAQAFVGARTEHRQAQASLKRAHRTTNQANTAADNALRMLEASTRYNRGSDVAALLRSLRDGRPLSAITGLPNTEQPEVVEDYVARMQTFVDSGEISREHVTNVSDTNAALDAAVTAEGEATRHRSAKSAALDQAQLEFLRRYRPFIRLAIGELGEDGAAALLPSFVRGSAADTEDEDGGEDEPDEDEEDEEDELEEDGEDADGEHEVAPT